MITTLLCFIALMMMFGYLALILCSPFYYKWGVGKRFYHNMLGWHIPKKKEIHQIGDELHSECKLCSREIIQDPRGTWYSY